MKLKPLDSRKQIVDYFKLLSLGGLQTSTAVEKRNTERINYPFPVYLTPLESGNQFEIDETFGVIGRQLSERGFDFYHCEPIPQKHVIASFECSPNRYLGLKMKLTWCRFGRHGYFENGGEFLEITDSPLGVAPF